MYPIAVVAFGLFSYYAAAAWRQRRAAALVAALLWLLYAVYEVLIARAILCDEKCNIRADVLLLWPVLWTASFFASKPPGKWSPLTKVFGFVSIGSLTLALALIGLMFAEDADLFFPERRACKAGGEGAILACTEALRQKSEDFTLYYYRGLAYRAKGEADRALADMNTALESYGDYTDALIGRGTLYVEKGDIERALSDFDAVLKLDAKSASALYGRGLAKVKKGDRSEGEADMAAAQAIDGAVAAKFSKLGLK